MKEKALQRSEEDEIRELKSLIISKLSEANVKGFETRQQLLEIITQGKRDKNQGMMEEETNIKYELDERTFITYKKNQFELLKRLLTSSYFLQNRNDNTSKEMEEERAAQFLSEVHNKSGAPHYTRREKKVFNIKLSRYIRNDLINMKNSQVDVKKFTESLKDEDYHKIGFNELEKFIKTKSDKSYYNPKVIEENFDKVKKYLLELNKKGNVSIGDLTDAELDELINACSFSLNGVHYLQKFEKSKNMIHPIDLLFTLSRLK